MPGEAASCGHEDGTASARRLDPKALDKPRGLRVEEFSALIAAFGFAFRRQTGSHRTFDRRDIAERATSRRCRMAGPRPGRYGSS